MVAYCESFLSGKQFLEEKGIAHISEYRINSCKDVLPLPDLALYGNFYYKDKFFKVLTVQLGASVRYHTQYYGNAYMPALGQFYLQKDMLISWQYLC